MHLIVGQMISPEHYQDRISGILFRYFYFIPLLYFLEIPYRNTFSKERKNWSRAISSVYHWLQWGIIKRRYIFCSIGIMITGGIEIFGGLRNFQNHQQNVVPFMTVIEQEINITQNESIPKGTIVYENLATNLASTILTENTTLLVSSFGNYVREQEILERLILYARIFNWSEDKFLNFMTPAKGYRPFHQVNRSLDNIQLLNGLGYWLLNHHRILSEDQMEAFRKNLISQFYQLNVEDALSRYQVKLVLAKNPVGQEIKGVKNKQVGQYFLIRFSNPTWGV
jgi:hypothetical protein